MTNLLPNFTKPFIRFIYYKEHRSKIFREIKIRRQQDELIKQYDPDTRKLIVFLIPGADWYSGTDKITGGTISIVSLCEESTKLAEIHSAPVIMCTFPNEHLLLHHTQFINNTKVFRYQQLRKYFTKIENILFHIPEFQVIHFIKNLHKTELRWLQKVNNLHINILNQNIKLMPSPMEINEIKSIASVVTITTAHQQYCNKEYRNAYNVPLHKFSVWISPEKYKYTSYHKKENLIVISPDAHEMKDAVIEKLNGIKGLKVQIIQNLTYEKYKETIARAKWALTFGEGLDGYIIEPIFSGAIGFAVYNENFFTPDFAGLKTIYFSFDMLINKMIEDMQELNKEVSYTAYQKQQFELCRYYYNYQEYQNNIAAFYRGNYTYK